MRSSRAWLIFDALSRRRPQARKRKEGRVPVIRFYDLDLQGQGESKVGAAQHDDNEQEDETGPCNYLMRAKHSLALRQKYLLPESQTDVLFLHFSHMSSHFQVPPNRMLAHCLRILS